MPGAKIAVMSTRAELHRMVDALSDPQVSTARIVVEEPLADGEGEHKSHAIVDEWGDLGAMTDAAAAETSQRLDEEDSAAGHEPWQP
jgi:hypothetical protein